MIRHVQLRNRTGISDLSKTKTYSILCPKQKLIAFYIPKPNVKHWVELTETVSISGDSTQNQNNGYYSIPKSNNLTGTISS